MPYFVLVPVFHYIYECNKDLITEALSKFGAKALSEFVTKALSNSLRKPCSKNDDRAFVLRKPCKFLGTSWYTPAFCPLFKVIEWVWKAICYCTIFILNFENMKESIDHRPSKRLKIFHEHSRFFFSYININISSDFI